MMRSMAGGPPTGRERSGTLSAFAHRNFRLFYTGQAVSLIGNWLTVVAQTLFVLELADSGVALGLLSAAQFGPMLVLGAWAGLRVDRSDKRRLLFVVQIVAMLQSLSLAALAFWGRPPCGEAPAAGWSISSIMRVTSSPPGAPKKSMARISANRLRKRPGLPPPRTSCASSA